MPPAACGVLTHPDLAGDRSVGITGSGRQDDPGSQYIAVRTTSSVRAAGQHVAFFAGQDDDNGAGGRHVHF